MDRADYIGVVFIAAIAAQEFRLSLSIGFRNKAAARARPTGVVRCGGTANTMPPFHDIVQRSCRLNSPQP